VLDGKFCEIEVTDQVNWILQHTGAGKGAYSGQYCIVLTVAPGSGSTGKVNLACHEACAQPGAGDNPWNRDGNTCHLLVSGELSAVSVERNPAPDVTGSLSLSSMPNPFTRSTSITYHTVSGKGMLRVYSANGALVFSQDVCGSGSAVWNSGKLAAGVYVCRLSAGNLNASRRIVLAR
jgi:hypothetical protein